MANHITKVWVHVVGALERWGWPAMGLLVVSYLVFGLTVPTSDDPHVIDLGEGQSLTQIAKLNFFDPFDVDLLLMDAERRYGEPLYKRASSGRDYRKRELDYQGTWGMVRVGEYQTPLDGLEKYLILTPSALTLHEAFHDWVLQRIQQTSGEWGLTLKSDALWLLVSLEGAHITELKLAF